MSTAQRPLRRFIIAAFWLAAWLMPLATVGFADSFEADAKLCNSDAVPPEDTISACTRQIESGRLKEGNLADSYYNRANKWKAKSELDKERRVQERRRVAEPAPRRRNHRRDASRRRLRDRRARRRPDA